MTKEKGSALEELMVIIVAFMVGGLAMASFYVAAHFISKFW